MPKFTYLHQDQTTNNDLEAIFGRSDEAYTNEREITLKGYAEYLAHVEEAGQMSLQEGLVALEVHEDVSSGGFAELRVGDPDGRTNLCLNTLSGINAVLSMASQKYQRLTPNAHLAWFDPRTRAAGILTVWEPNLDRWVVYDWVNGSYQPSESIVPTPQGKNPTNDNRRYWFQSEKHQQIKEYLTSRDFGTTWLVVMNYENELTHYQTKISDRLEMSLAEVWKATANDWNASNIKRQLTSNKARPASSAPVSKERQEFIDKLKRLKTPHIVKFDSGTGGISTVLFDASDPDLKADFLNGVLYSSPKVDFLSFEKVTD